MARSTHETRGLHQLLRAPAKRLEAIALERQRERSLRSISPTLQRLPQLLPSLEGQGTELPAPLVELQQLHVEIPHLAQHAGEPAQVPQQRVQRPPLEAAGESTERRAQPPRRDAHLVEELRIEAEERARPVGQHGLQLSAADEARHLVERGQRSEAGWRRRQAERGKPEELGGLLM